jgi:hypothetical protein
MNLVTLKIYGTLATSQQRLIPLRLAALIALQLSPHSKLMEPDLILLFETYAE